MGRTTDFLFGNPNGPEQRGSVNDAISKKGDDIVAHSVHRRHLTIVLVALGIARVFRVGLEPNDRARTTSVRRPVGRRF